jgi:hypothetical protein
MEIANCGDARYELKALELLGKHSDIGIFTERSEITVNYKDADDLEKAIKDRVKRLLNASVVETVPITDQIDAKLGVAKTSRALGSQFGLYDDIEEVEELVEDESQDDEPDISL